MRSFLVRHRPSRPTLLALFAIFLAAGGTNAYGAAVSFLLNQSNTATAQTALNAPIAGKAGLKLTNANAAAGSSALNLTVANGHQPFTVSAGAGKVANLNADKLDGLDSSQLQRTVAGGCAFSTPEAIDQIAPNGTVSCAPIPILQWTDLSHGPFPNAAYVFQLDWTGGPLTFLFDSTAYTNAAGGGSLQVDLVYCTATPCDGNNLITSAASAYGYSNETTSHKTLLPGVNRVNLPAGTYYFNVLPRFSTLTDGNDQATVAIWRG